MPPLLLLPPTEGAQVDGVKALRDHVEPAHLGIAEDRGAQVSIVLTKADQTEEISEVKSIIKAVAEDKPIFVVALRGSVTEGLDEINELMEAGKTIAS